MLSLGVGLRWTGGYYARERVLLCMSTNFQGVQFLDLSFFF